MQYGTIDGPGQRPPGLRVLQKWAIAAAIFVLLLQIISIASFAPVVGPNVHGQSKTIGIIAILLAAFEGLSCILLLVPACTKEHQAAYKWRLMVIPFMICQVVNIIFTIGYYIIFVFLSTALGAGGALAVGYAVIPFLVAIAMSIVLMACAYYMQKDLQLQGSGPVGPSDNL